MKYIVLEHHPNDSRVRVVEDEICQSLTQRMGTGGCNVPIILVLNDQGGEVINCEKQEISPTLRAQDHGHPPIVIYETNDSNRKEILPMVRGRCIRDLEK